MPDITAIRLELTCEAFPEQYDAYDASGRRVGYLRLRHGKFTVEYPDIGGRLVYSAEPQGDGQFTDTERGRYLATAIQALATAIHEDPMQKGP
jgi:hypothetical protein